MVEKLKLFVSQNARQIKLYYRLTILFIYIFPGLTIFFQGHQGAAIAWFFLTSPLLLSPVRTRNVFTIMTVYLILEPLLLMACGSFLMFQLFESINSLFYMCYFLFFIPMISGLYIILNRKNYARLSRVKIALDYNNAIFIAGVGLSVIYAYSTTDFTYMKSVVNLQQITKDGFQARDAFSYVVSIISFPFLVSTALNKAIIEHITKPSPTNQPKDDSSVEEEMTK